MALHLARESAKQKRGRVQRTANRVLRIATIDAQ